jgi:hypothetical protein
MTRPFSRDELVQMAYDYVAAGGRGTSIETAEQIIDGASMLGRVVPSNDPDQDDVSDERVTEDGDAEIVLGALVEAVAGDAGSDVLAAWSARYAESSAPLAREFSAVDRGELIELIDELTEWREDLSRLPDGGGQLRADYAAATQALADLDAGRQVLRADDDDGAWFLTIGMEVA